VLNGVKICQAVKSAGNDIVDETSNHFHKANTVLLRMF
jgi:hypothetical protein